MPLKDEDFLLKQEDDMTKRLKELGIVLDDEEPEVEEKDENDRFDFDLSQLDTPSS